MKCCVNKCGRPVEVSAIKGTEVRHFCDVHAISDSELDKFMIANGAAPTTYNWKPRSLRPQ